MCQACFQQSVREDGLYTTSFGEKGIQYLWLLYPPPLWHRGKNNFLKWHVLDSGFTQCYGFDTQYVFVFCTSVCSLRLCFPNEHINMFFVRHLFEIRVYKNFCSVMVIFLVDNIDNTKWFGREFQTERFFIQMKKNSSGINSLTTTIEKKKNIPNFKIRKCILTRNLPLL